MNSETTTRRKANTSPAGGARKRSARRRKLLLSLFGVLLLGAIVAGLWPKPIGVETAAVTVGPLTVSVLEEGKTRIRYRYVISPPVAGFLDRVALRAGDPVQAGKTVLATVEAQSSGFLDPRARAEAEARVNAAEATSHQRQSDLTRARAALDLAKSQFARAEALGKEGIIARQEYDTAENRVQVLTSELNSAGFAKRVAEFELDQARVALEQLKSPEPGKSKVLRILAPVDGYVLNVYEENARVVAAGAPIMELGDPRDLEAEIELLSSDAVDVAPGADVSIEEWGGDKPLRGRVRYVERGGYTKVSALGVEEQRVKVHVDFIDQPPPGHPLGDRFRVEARIVTWRGGDVLQVPTGALFRRGSAWMTFIVENGKARQRKVEINHNNGLAAEVRAGLKKGDTVIVYPPDGVTDGVSVATAPK